MSLQQSWNPTKGTPVFTVKGRYTSRSWTEWTQGFQFGSALLQFDATGDDRFLELGRSQTLRHMAAHVSHMGVHDHGFNNISTYGNLFRLMRELRSRPTNANSSFTNWRLKSPGQSRQRAGRQQRREGDSFTPSMGRTRCLSIRCARCAPWLWDINLATY